MGTGPAGGEEGRNGFVTFEKMQVHSSVPKNDAILLHRFFEASSPKCYFQGLG